MKSLVILFLSLIMSSFALAEATGPGPSPINTIRRSDTLMAAEGGIRQQSASTDFDNDTIKSQTGYELGVSAIFPLNTIGIRTGLFYSVRPFSLSDNSGNTSTITFSYFDIPAEITYQVGDYAWIYGGILLAWNLDSNSSNNVPLKNVSSTLVPVQVGAMFKFAPDLGADVYFESSSGSVADHFSNLRAVGLNLFFTFD